MSDDERVPLTLVSGLAADACAELAEVLRAGDPGTAVVRHDLRQLDSGVVHRGLRLGARDQLTAIELAHGCVSCTLREDLLPLLRRLAHMPQVGRIVVVLDPAIEPEPVSWALRHVWIDNRPVIEDVRIDAVYTVLDRSTWFADATGDDVLAERGLAAGQDDDRTLAQVALAQAEFADVLVFGGGPADLWRAARTGAVLDRVAPLAPRVPFPATASALRSAVPETARRGEIPDPHGPLVRGQPPLGAETGVELFTFGARRPFHPGRLHDAIDVLLDGVVRTRGRIWVASQPDSAMWLESAGGGLGVGKIGPWLAAPDGPSWDDVPAERRAMAALRWDPEFGDREQNLVVVSHHARPDEIRGALESALLTEDEIALGPTHWRRIPDPFAEWHADPCESPDQVLGAWES